MPFGNSENPLTMGNLFQNISEQPLALFRHLFLMTKWAERLIFQENAKRYHGPILRICLSEAKQVISEKALQRTVYTSPRFVLRCRAH